MSMRLEALTLLPAEMPESQRATQMIAQLFPLGLGFLQLPYDRQWALCESAMRTIGDGPVAEELEELIGEPVLRELRAAHKNYGRALGITQAKAEAATTPNLANAARTLQEAFTEYALQLLAAGRADPSLGEAVMACLRPLDNARELELRRANARGGVPEPVVAPTPPEVPQVPLIED